MTSVLPHRSSVARALPGWAVIAWFAFASGIVQAAAGTIQFANGGGSTNEGDAETITYTVIRSGGSVGEVSVDYFNSGGNATPGNDFEAVSGTLTWIDGDIEPKAFTVDVFDDIESENTENFGVTLVNATGGAIVGDIAYRFVSITDNDTPPGGTLEFSTSGGTTDEGDAETITYTVTRSGGSAGDVSVDYFNSGGNATPGDDFEAVSGTLTWIDGDLEPKAFTVGIVDDTESENTENFGVTLLNATGGAIVGDIAYRFVSIVDDDAPAGGTLEFATSGGTTNEGDAETITYTVIRSGGSIGEVSAEYFNSGGNATPGNDFEAVSGTLTWSDGDIEPKAFTVDIVDDTESESTENFGVTLVNATGGAIVGDVAYRFVSIVDDDLESPGILSFDADTAATEAAGAAALTVRRDAGNDGAVSIAWTTADGSALAGEDYGAQSGTLTWADNDAAPRTIVIDLIDDSAIEGDEAFGVVLANPGGGAVLGTDDMATALIIDDDAPAIFSDGFE